MHIFCIYRNILHIYSSKKYRFTVSNQDVVCGKGADIKMDCLNSNVDLMLHKSMDYLWCKQTCILDNISNAETPGYKTKYVTFEESLQQAIQAAASGAENPGPAIREAIDETSATIHQADESTRMDDNGVNITEQMVELSRNGYQMQYVMDAISSDFSLLRTAITG